ncbi:MAG: c-type cytochrome [Myxococcota bacterium]|nr:c-type cytochrome [Myxococcota bacterium]
MGLSGGAFAEGDLERGEKLYGLCSQCHGVEGEGVPLSLAPSIAGLPAWYVESQLKKFYGGIRGRHPDDIGGMRMRPMTLYFNRPDTRDADFAAVSAYVASLEPKYPEPLLSGGDPEKGQASYSLCIACHGADGLGNEALQAPPIVQISDWYALTQLKNYKNGIRGRDPRDSAGATMWPMAMTLEDEQAMKDVIAYIETLRGSN